MAVPNTYERKIVMAKTNKELAVELYCAFLKSSGSMFASPNFKGTIKYPTVDEMINVIKEMEEKLSTIKEN